MKKMLFWALLLCPVFLTAQTVDSVALGQADSLIQAASASANNQDITKAIELNTLAEKFVLEKFGRESAVYARCCYNHGRILINSGQVTDGLKWVFDALKIREKVLGKTHIDCGKTKYLIGYGFMELSQYEKGIDVVLEAKSILENAEGKTGLYYACIDLLAICYASIGDFERAEPFFWEARTLGAKAGGAESEEYARITSNLSHFYKLIGNYQKSLELAKEATEISRNFLGDRGKKIYAISLGNLGSAYSRLNKFDKAEALHLESISIMEQIEGKESRQYLERMHDLAVLYSVTRKHQKALLLFEQILAIKEKLYGLDNLSYTSSANSLAILHMEMGEYEKAETVLASCIETNKKILGADSDSYLEELANMAILYNATGKYEAAETLHIEISGKSQRMMANGLQHLSERELEDFIKKVSYFQSCALSLAQTTFPRKRTGAALSQICFDNALYFKGFMLNAVNRIRISTSLDTANAENVLLLKSIQRRLGDAYSQPMVERDNTFIADLQTQANSLEKELARSISGYADASRSVRWQDVQQHLRAGEVAIEFVHFAYYSKSIQWSTDSTFYAAVILQPGADAPKFIPLFEEKQLTALLNAEQRPQPNFYNDLYATDKKGAQLYDLIWKPVIAAIPESSTIYCSPSGLLHRLNLAAIPTPDSKTLSEKHRLIMLGSTRSLIEGTKAVNLAVNQNATAQLYGGIQYDASTTIAINTKPSSDDLAARRGPNPLPASPNWEEENDSTLRGDSWNNLRWTDVEISAAAEIMQSKGIAVTLKKGAEATEESFKAIGTESHSPRILHVATHGFFFPDPKASKPGEGQAVGEKTFKVSDNPMIRSGLVLAGGNHAWKTGKPLRPDQEDGILTAYEISQMNLSNTELVVLSACETGLGDLVGNEGVYGLQRAFKIAGVRYLIMSLWQVPDFQTQVFMSAFYNHWLEGEMAIPEAFRATQSELKAKYGEAFKWAGFVLVE